MEKFFIHAKNKLRLRSVKTSAYCLHVAISFYFYCTLFFATTWMDLLRERRFDAHVRISSHNLPKYRVVIEMLFSHVAANRTSRTFASRLARVPDLKDGLAIKKKHFHP